LYRYAEVLDADGSGAVNLEEFVAWFKGGCPLAKKDGTADKANDDAAKNNIVDKDAAAAITAAAAEEEDADEAKAAAAAKYAEILSEINMD
jgi:hypothetical protein